MSSPARIFGVRDRVSALLLLAVALCGCSGASPAPASPVGVASTPSVDPKSSESLRLRALEVLGVLPTPRPDPPEQVALGRRLFFDTRVSADGKVGCVTCHLPGIWASDGLPRAKGAFGRVNPRNSPTVFNAAYQFAAHWRADRDSVEDQARKALLGKPSFGLSSDAEAVERLNALAYTDAFRVAFPHDPNAVSVSNWGTALGAYERTLVTPAPFDAFLRGDSAALSESAKAGLVAFLDEGCAGCHSGPLLGGNSLRKFGVHSEYAPLTHSDPVDAGRFDVTKQEGDRYVFKVAALRNVAKTAPYFHDGSVTTLPAAVAIMAEAQLGRKLASARVDAIVTFLETLTGPLPANFSPPDSPGP